MAGIEKSGSEKPTTILGWLKSKQTPKQQEQVKTVDTQKTSARTRISQETQTDLKGLSMSHAKKRSFELVGQAGITEAKTILKRIGLFKGAVDGVYSPDMFQAVIAFQKRETGVQLDGVLGPNTLAALRKSGNSARVSETQTSQRDTPKKTLFGGLFGSNTSQDSVDVGSESFPQLNPTLAKQYLQKMSSSDRGKLARSLKVRNTYDEIIKAIATKQHVLGLKADGVLGSKTQEAFTKAEDLNYATPMKTREVKRFDNQLKSIETGNLEIPRKWKKVFDEFFLTTNSQKEKNEILSGKYPIALADSRTKRGIIIMGGNTIEFPVVLGSGIVRAPSKTIIKNGKKIKILGKIIKRSPQIKNGFSQGDHSSNAGVIYRFDGVAPRKGGGYKAVSPEARKPLPGHKIGGLKWWHGVPSNQKATWGCTGVPFDVMEKLTRYIRQKGKGFGYLSRV